MSVTSSWYWDDDLKMELLNENPSVVAIIRIDSDYQLNIDSPWIPDLREPVLGQSYMAMVE
jgi:hypothetical protein